MQRERKKKGVERGKKKAKEGKGIYCTSEKELPDLTRGVQFEDIITVGGEEKETVQMVPFRETG